jgi:hypothetical protein
MRSIVFVLIITLAICFTASAQSKGDLRKYFEGKQLKLRINVPVKDGVDVYPERSQSFDYSEYDENLKGDAATIKKGAIATVREIRFTYRNIEVRILDSNDQRSSFNLHFSRIEAWMLTPATVIDGLNRFVEFADTDKREAILKSSSVVAAGYVRNGVVHLGPRTTFLKEGLTTEDVFRLLGEPSARSNRNENGKMVATFEFQRGEGRVLVADFVENALIGSRIEMRTVAFAGSTNLLVSEIP